MDALLSFLRDVRNWAGFVLGCVAVLLGLAICYLIGRALERRLPAGEPEPVTTRVAALPAPPTVSPTAPPAPTPTAALSDCWFTPADIDEARAFITGLPSDLLVELDGVDFTVAEIERLLAVKAAHTALESDA